MVAIIAVMIVQMPSSLALAASRIASRRRSPSAGADAAVSDGPSTPVVAEAAAKVMTDF
jgi:hypothetical protein